MTDPDDKLRTLSRLETPSPSQAARARAIAQARLAFEAEKAAPQKSASLPQGNNWGQRLKSILTSKRTWTMDIRYPVAAAALAVVVLPLGYQLYTSTAFTPPTDPGRQQVALNEPGSDQPAGDAVVPPADPQPEITQTPVEPVQPPLGQNMEPIEPPPEPAQPPATLQAEPVLVTDAVSEPQSAPVTTDNDADDLVRERAEEPPEAVASGADMAAAPPPSVAPEPMQSLSESDAEAVIMPSPVSSPEFGRTAAPSGGVMSSESFAPPPPMVEPSGDEFTDFVESPVKTVAEEPVSTFSIDVDTASYSYVRRMLQDGYMPEADAVRIEEMVNYFSYDYPTPPSAEVPFQPTMTVTPTPWNPDTQLLHIGIRGYEPPVETDVASNLVFLIDTSGSMDEPDKLPLLKRAFRLLVEQLSANDTVSIIVYAGSAGVVLEPTPATERSRILGALDNLAAGGSTAGAEGIELAYRLAEQARIQDGVNRVILATDGDFNVGISDPEDLVDFIKAKRETGVFLSVLGFGRGNLDDATMQALAQNGNGNAAYIDSFTEARKVLVEEGNANLVTIASDVKIQVEFNPAFISEYRLIGYETRALNREDFNNDRVDAGDVGAGHTVTAIYEITPVNSPARLVDPLRFGGEQATGWLPQNETSNEIAFLKLRYKLPNEDESRLLEVPVTQNMALPDFAQASDDVRFSTAVAAFAQTLKGSVYGAMPYQAILDLAQNARGDDPNGYRAEFLQLIQLAESLAPKAGK